MVLLHNLAVVREQARYSVCFMLWLHFVMLSSEACSNLLLPAGSYAVHQTITQSDNQTMKEYSEPARKTCPAGNIYICIHK